MSIPSRVLGSGNSGLATINICGDGATNLTAAGASAGASLQLSAVYNNVTTTGASTGVKLPKCENGALVFVNNAGASTLTVYPATGDDINATTSASIATTKTRLFFGVSATAWISLLGA